jgi:hypothetical protein
MTDEEKNQNYLKFLDACARQSWTEAIEVLKPFAEGTQSEVLKQGLQDLQNGRFPYDLHESVWKASPYAERHMFSLFESKGRKTEICLSRVLQLLTFSGFGWQDGKLGRRMKDGAFIETDKREIHRFLFAYTHSPANPQENAFLAQSAKIGANVFDQLPNL